MKQHLLTLICFCTLLIFQFVACIQYGTDVINPNQYPFYIMIGNPHICGGTLLSYDPPLVLTAAHCIADADFKPIEFPKQKNPYFASYYHIQRDKQKSISIVDWTIHPLYNVSGSVSGVNPSYDVAIVRLGSPLMKSARVKRVPLWSTSMTDSLPTRGELIGFGYTGIGEKEEAQNLKRLSLDVTRFDPTAIGGNIEARSDTEEHIACHGDSGSPLVVYRSITHMNKTMQVPYVVGNLARIYGARDANPKVLTCPVPTSEVQQRSKASFNSSSQNTVIESFCNIANMLDWISEVTHISKEHLSDPFFAPPHPPCVNCRIRKKPTTTEEDSKTNGHHSGTDIEDGSFNDYYDDGDEDEEATEDGEDDDMDGSGSRQNSNWHIGVATDEHGLLDNSNTMPTSFYIGAMAHGFQLSTVKPNNQQLWQESIASTCLLKQHVSFVSLLLFTFSLFILIIY